MRKTDCRLDRAKRRLLRGRHELRLLSEEIDHLADKVAPNTESREDILIFRNNVLADEPSERRMLDPVAEKRRARILDHAPGFESRDSGDEHRSVDNSSRPIFPTSQR